MSFDFDRIIETGARVVDSAKNVAVDLAQKGKRQADLLTAQTKLSKAERQLGALVYSLDKNGEENDALVRKYIDAIASIEADITRLKTEEAAEPKATAPYEAPVAAPQPEPETKPAASCPQCGQEVKEDALFCDGCGAQL